MSKQNRRNFDSDFKLKVAIEAIKEQQTMRELAVKYELPPNQIIDWNQTDFYDLLMLRMSNC